MATNKKKNGPLGTIIFMVLFAAVVIGIYFAITRGKNTDTKEIPAETSEADALIKRTWTGNILPPRERC